MRKLKQQRGIISLMFLLLPSNSYYIATGQNSELTKKKKKTSMKRKENKKFDTFNDIRT